jgi:hypothetical protein
MIIEELLPQTQTIIEKPLPQTEIIIEEKQTPVSLPLVNGSNSSVRVQYVPSAISPDVVAKTNGTNKKKKTVDLLFEMKQCKTLGEKQAKKIQQQFGRNRAQHRKRAMHFISMGDFVDHAFGLDKNELEKQLSSNENHSSSSSPQVNLEIGFRIREKNVLFLDFTNII